MKEMFFVFLIICIALIACGIVAVIFWENIKGWFWRRRTKQALKKLPKDKYTVLNDLFITTNRSINQIDHLVISQYGIFVIMTKQYTGEIVGQDKFRNWFKYSGRKMVGLRNPILQNYYHVYAISQLLCLGESKIYNVVCFPSMARYHIRPCGGEKKEGIITRNTTIVDKILSYYDIVINDINPIIEKINNSNITNRALRKKHIRNIKRIEQIRNMKDNIYDENSDKCPECGSPLRYRYGRFSWIRMTVCSNYFDKCKYIKSEKVEDKEVCDCLICGGKILEEGGYREKVYYGCSNYECNARYTIINNNFYNMLSSPENFEERKLKF